MDKDRIKGSIKQGAGKVVGNDKLKGKGAAEKMKGKTARQKALLAQRKTA